MLKILIVVALLALAVWFLVRFLDGRAGSGQSRRPRPSAPPRVTGPDDDPEFLRDLERRRRREQREGPDAPSS